MPRRLVWLPALALLAWLLWRSVEVYEVRTVPGTSWMLPLLTGHGVYVQRLADGPTTVFVEGPTGENALTWVVLGA